jgi:hypothetical protein
MSHEERVIILEAKSCSLNLALSAIPCVLIVAFVLNLETLVSTHFHASPYQTKKSPWILFRSVCASELEVHHICSSLGVGT